jgi:hypothetical protein
LSKRYRNGWKELGLREPVSTIPNVQIMVQTVMPVLIWPKQAAGFST